MMDLQLLPVIDWEIAVKQAGNDPEFAKDLLSMLTRNLPDDLSSINQSFEARNYVELRKLLHKLHGALCYCGAPRLKMLVSRLEMDIKNNTLDNISELMVSLNQEVALLLTQAKIELA